MITLDGVTFYVFQNNYAEPPFKFNEAEVGLTGATLYAEAVKGDGDALTEKRYQLTLVCTTTEIAALEEIFRKAGALDLTDERGVFCDAALGEGVLFLTMGAPKPAAATGWSVKNRFFVDVELLQERAGE